MSLAGVYVHIPFCKSKCPYCDFYSIVGDKKIQKEYVDAVLNNINNTKKYKDADTLYFGGGTPVLLDAKLLEQIVNAVKNKFNLLDEITLEANPCITTKDKLIELYKAGFNRISFGMQSANQNELDYLGRNHVNQDIINAVTWAKEAGFKNISIDIMLGTPKQTKLSVKNTLDFLIALDIQHISAYMLKIEKGTKFDCDDIRNIVPDEDEISDIYLFVCEYLSQNGFVQYEISNFSKKGYESKHNLKYWKYDDYYAFGASAHGFVNGVRYSYPRDIKQYIETNGENYIIEQYDKCDVQEYLMLRLRLTEGLNLKELSCKYNVDIDGLIKVSDKFIKYDLMQKNNDNVYLNPKGFLLSNYIISEFMLYIS